jgi:hypothetical protein
MKQETTEETEQKPETETETKTETQNAHDEVTVLTTPKVKTAAYFGARRGRALIWCVSKAFFDDKNLPHVEHVNAIWCWPSWWLYMCWNEVNSLPICAFV